MQEGFNPDEARRHLNAIWGGYEGDLKFEIRIIPPRWGKGWPIVKLFLGPDEAVEWLESSWERLNLGERNVFYGVLPRHGRLKGAGRSEDVKCARVAFCDLDYHEELGIMEALLMGKIDEGAMKEGIYAKGRERVVVEGGKVSVIRKPEVSEVIEEVSKALGREPSLVVDSGHGYHIYYILEKVVDVYEWALIQSKLISSLKGDERVKDPARLLRVAGTINPRYRLFPARCRIVYESEERLPV